MLDLHLTAPIDRWDEAIPLGNGLMGTLLWGAKNQIKLSLDRGDMWDLRPIPTFEEPDWNWATLKRLVKEKNHAEIVRRFDEPYNGPYPTKIPAGRIEITLGRGVGLESFNLDLARAIGSSRWKGGAAQVFCSATASVGMVLLTGKGAAAAKVRVVPAAFGGNVTVAQKSSLQTGDLAVLGYPPPVVGRSGTVQWSLQRSVDSFAFAIVVATRNVVGGLLVAYTVTCTNDGPDPVAIGKARVADAVAAGFSKMLRPHVAWWKKFWSQSRVKLPDKAIQQHYEIVQYFYGSASRRGAPPMPLQGVWTADEGKLPPWKGDYHHDLNTQLTYWAYLQSGHWEEGLCFLDFLWDLLPRGRKFAKEFYGTPGAILPGVAALDGQPLGGWAQYTVVPINSAWLAHAFYLHWRYTMDQEFLRSRAYPWCAEVGTALAAMLEPDANEKLKLPLSASPEVHDNTLKAWMTPNTTYDLSLLRWLFGALVEMAREIEDDAAATHWSNLLAQLDDFAVAEDWGGPALRLAVDESLTESHRHFSQLMPIHPLGTLHIEGSDHDRAVIKGSLTQIDRLGSGYWCGYSFSWMSCIAARAEQAEKSRTMLETYLKACTSRNGFHLNGDYKNLGVSAFKYRPFTLEGNFAAAQAVHEMLLQSWGGTVRVFPCVSESWRDVSFDNLCAEGAMRVSAVRRDGKTSSVRVTAHADTTLRLRDPFVGNKVKWSQRGVARQGSDWIISLRAGQTVEAIRM
ncbi:MAG: glycoside hydrolase N-terminal domain-containing protein [Phycisphaeraceae bacterium]|nr:glycoside hydrolase N-terminal domain-containing protein [Phycisphaeraceae bacterium]